MGGNICVSMQGTIKLEHPFPQNNLIQTVGLPKHMRHKPVPQRNTCYHLLSSLSTALHTYIHTLHNIFHSLTLLEARSESYTCMYLGVYTNSTKKSRN
mmetsp:Transcript_66033/g.129927  ORF Transcript_66033/g.129927 Transcript_66033/m.129927 type:complete len:98 (+) Transcript_66033:54-347(+)